MYQAIQTKYLAATNVRGSRIKATAAAGSITLHFDSGLNSEANHVRAARQLAERYGWEGTWHGGSIPGTSGYAFVLASDDPRDGFKVSPA